MTAAIVKINKPVYLRNFLRYHKKILHGIDTADSAILSTQN